MFPVVQLPLPLPPLLLQLLLDRLVLFAQSPATNVVELARSMESLVNVDASKFELEGGERAGNDIHKYFGLYILF